MLDMNLCIRFGDIGGLFFLIFRECFMDAVEVGFAVADAEGEVVDVGDARARVGVSAL